MSKFIDYVFSEKSPLLKIIDNFEHRSCQREMAQAVYQTLQNKKSLIVEAGTGVGKTLAYLVPISLWVKENKKKIVVSTYTKILQNQIIDKDIPILRKILGFFDNGEDNEKIFEDLNFAVVFGQENYICRRRLESTMSYGLFDTPYEFSQLESLQTWLNEGGSGIILEFSNLLGKSQDKICRDGDICKYQKCSYYEDCYYFNARKQWLTADLLITNHFLFFANVAADYFILPKFDAVIFDEAHKLEEVIAHFFGLEISNFGLHRLINSIYNPMGRTGLVTHLSIGESDQRKIKELCQAAHQEIDNIFLQCQKLFRDNEQKKRLRNPLHIENNFDRIALSLFNVLLNLDMALVDEDLELELKGRLRRLDAYRNSINQFLEANDKNLVYWIELNNNDSKKSPYITLNSALIDIGELFTKQVVNKLQSVILTSATLTVDQSFDFIKNRLGLNDIATLYLASPFDYQKQALLVIPTDLPLPNEEDKFFLSVSKKIDQILTYSNGRALVLFTSFDALSRTYDLIEKTKFPIFRQGEAPIFDLLEDFRKNISSVLLATQSFWQGIDVPGESLSCLIIVRLPFDVPDDPRLAGICEKLREQNIEPFINFQLPNAVLRFRQGFGRLIRNKQDRGVVCVLDKRIITKEYGKQFLNSLPKNLPIAFSVNSIKDFFEINTKE